MSEKDKAKTTEGYKIDVRPYKVKIPDAYPEGHPQAGQIRMEHGKPVMIVDDFDVKGSLCDILFNRELQLRPEEMFKAFDLCKKIRVAEDFILLDVEEYGRIKRAYDVLKGGSENMIEFLSRIRDAQKIQLGEVQEVKDVAAK